MEENQTVTYFLRSRLFTYDIMKNFNCNISLWFFKSKFRSYIGKHFFFIKIMAFNRSESKGTSNDNKRVQGNLSKVNFIGTRFCGQNRQVKLTKFSYIKALFNAQFIQDSDLFKVKLRQISLYII